MATPRSCYISIKLPCTSRAKVHVSNWSNSIFFVILSPARIKLFTNKIVLQFCKPWLFWKTNLAKIYLVHDSLRNWDTNNLMRQKPPGPLETHLRCLFKGSFHTGPRLAAILVQCHRGCNCPPQPPPNPLEASQGCWPPAIGKLLL